MTLPTQSVGAWHERFKSFFRAIVGGAVDIWPNSWAVVAKVLALLAREIDLRLIVLYRQIFVSTADGDFVRRHAFEYGLAPRPAGRAAGFVTVIASGSGTLPAGLVFQRADGALYLSSAAVLAAPGAVAVPVLADTTGEAGNAGAGTVLALLSAPPVALAAPEGAVAPGGLGGGTPGEDIESLRARVLQRKRSPPQGGSATDWERWALQVPGVARVFVDSFSNTNRRVWLAITFADRVNGIPTGADVAAVQAHLDDPMLRPVTARVSVVAPVSQPVAVTATGVEPLTAGVSAAIRAELAALFAERMQPATPNRAFALPRAWVSEAISRATGEDRHTLTAPAADLLFTTPGHLPVLGTVTLS